MEDIGVAANEGGELEVGREAKEAAVAGEAVDGERESGGGSYERDKGTGGLEVNAGGNYGIESGVLHPLELDVDEIARLNVDDRVKVGGGIDQTPPLLQHHLFSLKQFIEQVIFALVLELTGTFNFSMFISSRVEIKIDQLFFFFWFLK